MLIFVYKKNFPKKKMDLKGGPLIIKINIIYYILFINFLIILS